MKCPICRKAVERTSEFFPFCSDRCRTIDLANWATGEYKVTTPLRPLDEDETNAGGIDTTEDEDTSR